MNKGATVYSNDPGRPIVNLTILGEVERFATVKPERLVLRGLGDDTIQGTVTITPEKKYPFKILQAKAMKGKDFTFELVDNTASDSGGYILNVVNRRASKGRYADSIELKTDSNIKPVITVSIFGQILDPEGKGKAKTK